jgi:hypothetical protein
MRLSHGFLRTILLAAVSFVAMAAQAQELDSDKKEAILSKMSEVILSRAFVPGVDFSKWPDFLDDRREAIDETESSRGFITEVNRALQEFGFSHIRLASPRSTSRRRGDGVFAVQRRGGWQRGPRESLKWIEEDAAVLRVSTFGREYSRSNVEKMLEDAAEKADFLVLDLRSNGGGAVNNLNHLLSHLLPDRTEYGTFISRRVFERYKIANPEGPEDVEAVAEWTSSKVKTRERTLKPFEGKIAVLINRGSASASEIAAAALRDTLQSPIVGTPSRGAVLASTFASLPEGYSLQYPVSDYVTAKGVRLEGAPLKPDLENSERPSREEDPAAIAALEVLKNGLPPETSDVTGEKGDGDGDGKLAA